MIIVALNESENVIEQPSVRSGVALVQWLLGREPMFLPLSEIFLLSFINFSNNFSWYFSRFLSENNWKIAFPIDLLPKYEWDATETFFWSIKKPKTISDGSQKVEMSDWAK